MARGVVYVWSAGMNDKRGPGPTLGEAISQMELSATNHHFEERSICLTYYYSCWWCNLQPSKNKKETGGYKIAYWRLL